MAEKAQFANISESGNEYFVNDYHCICMLYGADISATSTAMLFIIVTG